MNFKKFFKNDEWSELKEFENLTVEKKQIVFYAENKASFNHYRLLLKELSTNYNYTICIVTSINDKDFFIDDKIKIFFIGSGLARIKFFTTLKTEILITDTPDLNKYYLKRSKIYPVHYIYIFHSIFSVHSYLRENAIDDYDTIFCVGNHHIEEIKKTEEIYKLKNKKLIPYGFGRLDELEILKKQWNYQKNKRILIMPSYGKNNLIETCGKKLIKKLIENEFEVILRPHYNTLKESKQLLKEFEEEFSGKKFQIYKDVIPNDLFFNSLALISDWSGISFEYALINFKPVFFIDVPKKILNPNFERIKLIPLEINLRHEIGYIIHPNNIEKIINILKNSDKNFEKSKIEEIRDTIIFNFKKSSKIGAAEINKIMENKLIKK